MMDVELKEVKETIESKSSLGVTQMLSGKTHTFNVKGMQDFAKEGYASNPTVFSCIDLIGKAFSRIPVKVKDDKGEIVENSKLKKLVDRPNLNQGGVEFRYESIAWRLITGITFTERLMVGGMPSELYHWKPYQMSIQGNRIPSMYHYRKNMEGHKTWKVNQITGQSDMNHWSTFNPLPEENFIGQSGLQAGAVPADTYNAGMLWRYSSVKNGNVLDGILTPKGDKTLDDKQADSFLRKLTEKFKGARKAGNKIGVLGIAMDYIQMVSNARDAEFLGGTKLAKSEIAEVLGVPTQLIGVEGSNTYANYEQANKSFHYQTVIPLLELYLDDMNRWLGAFYPNEKLCFDLEDIPALEVDRKDRREQKITSKAYSINEIRAEFGDAPRDEIEADYVMTSPSEIPLGLDVFADDEKEEREVAKMLMRKGLSQKEAEQKALDLFHDS